MAPGLDGYAVCRRLRSARKRHRKAATGGSRNAKHARRKRNTCTARESEMGGTGLEPVTPSLSRRSSVRVSSLTFAQSAWLSGINRRANVLAGANERRALPLLPRGAGAIRRQYARPHVSVLALYLRSYAHLGRVVSSAQPFGSPLGATLSSCTGSEADCRIRPSLAAWAVQGGRHGPSTQRDR
jgi:hypothetical protein